MKILLICSAGMSTSLLVSKMEKSAEARGIECLIKAVSAADGKNVINDYDVVLLGPQVRYLKSDLQKVTDYKAMAVAGVMATPAVAIDGVIKLSGRIPKREEVRAWLT